MKPRQLSQGMLEPHTPVATLVGNCCIVASFAGMVAALAMFMFALMGQITLEYSAIFLALSLATLWLAWRLNRFGIKLASDHQA